MNNAALTTAKLDIVLIADRIFCSYREADINSNTLDMIDDEYFDCIYDGLSQASESLVHYNNLSEFIDNIRFHKNSLVLSIYGGYNSRNRLSLAPAICEAYKIKYVGADTYTKIISQDKYLSKKFVNDFEIKTPDSLLIHDLVELDIIEMLELPLVVKPNAENSSIGINGSSLVHTYSDAIKTSKELLNKTRPILIEEFIPGKEVSICVIGTPFNIQHFEMVEYYSEEKKDYFDSHLLTAFIQRKSLKIKKKLITSELGEADINAIKRLFFGLGKIDHFRIDGKFLDNRFVFLEMTPTPVLSIDCAMAFSYIAKGFSYNSFLKRIIDNSLVYYHNQKSNEPGN